MTDTLDPDLQEHLGKIATPALFGETVTAGKRTPFPHTQFMSDRCVQDWLAVRGSQRQAFLAMFVSVRHGKTTTVGHDFPGWAMGVFPGTQVLFVTYNETRAIDWSVVLRDTMMAWAPTLFQCEVRKDRMAADNWFLTNGSSFRAAGPGSSITGHGWDIIIIDDPIKNAEEADSEASRNGLRKFVFENILDGRVNPGGILILSMARWRHDDIAEDLVFQSTDEWDVVTLPAICECPEGEDPETWRDVIGRKEGDALWPHRMGVEFLTRARERLERADPRTWAGKWQQRPMPLNGTTFPEESWVKVAQRPTNVRGRVRAWDLAASFKKGDYTVGALCSVTVDGFFVIEHVVRERLDPAGVENLVYQTACIDGPDVMVAMEEEKGASGKANTNTFRRLLIGFQFIPLPVSGSKETRAKAYSAHQGNRLCQLVTDGTWHDDRFILEHTRFGYQTHDDQVDAAAMGFRALAQEGLVAAAVSHVSQQGEDDFPLLDEAWAFEDGDVGLSRVFSRFRSG